MYFFSHFQVKYGRDLAIIRDEFQRPMRVAGLLTSEQLQVHVFYRAGLKRWSPGCVYAAGKARQKWYATAGSKIHQTCGTTYTVYHPLGGTGPEIITSHGLRDIG